VAVVPYEIRKSIDATNRSDSILVHGILSKFRTRKLRTVARP